MNDEEILPINADISTSEPILTFDPQLSAQTAQLTGDEVRAAIANGQAAASLNLISVADLLAQLNITDVEQAEFAIGIIFADEAQGRFQYVRTGDGFEDHEFTDFDLTDPNNDNGAPVPLGQALILAEDTFIRFVADPDFDGEAGFTFRVSDLSDDTPSNPPSFAPDDSGGNAPTNTSSLSSAAFTVSIAADTDGDGIINGQDIDDDNDGVLDVLEGNAFDISNVTLPGTAQTFVQGDFNIFAQGGLTNGTGSTASGFDAAVDAGGASVTTISSFSGSSPFSGPGYSIDVDAGAGSASVTSNNAFVSGNGGTAISIIPPATEGSPGFTTTTTIDFTNPVFAAGFELVDIFDFGSGANDPQQQGLTGQVIVDGVLIFETGLDEGMAIPSSQTGSVDFRDGTGTLQGNFIAGQNIENFIGFTSATGISQIQILHTSTADPFPGGGNGNDFHGFDNLRFTNGQLFAARDTDNDGLADHIDTDSDDDGITDTIEAQATNAFQAPTGSDSDGDGLDNAFDATPNGTADGAGSLGLTPVDTDGLGGADIIDPDSDDDGIVDIAERGDGQGSTFIALDSDGDGLADVFENGTINDGFNTNEGLISGAPALSDSDNDAAAAVPLTADVDFRDALNGPDTDGDGIVDVDDVDDDNDGILDTAEGTSAVEFSRENSSTLSGTTTVGVDVTATFAQAPGTLNTTNLSQTNRIDNDNFTFLSNTDQLADVGVNFSNTQIDNFGTDQSLTFKFAGQNVSEVFLHVNSLDQFIINFTPTSSIGFEILSSVATPPQTGTDLAFGDATPSSTDSSRAQEEEDGFGGGSADGTIRFFSTDGTPITSLILGLTEQPGNLNRSDGWQFALELAVDSDGDGFADSRDIDSDNDGITDNVEAQATDTYIAPTGLDDDGDGLDNAFDATQNGTADGTGSFGLMSVDTDDDGTVDVLDSDSDDDSLLDIAERGDGQATSVTSTADADGDGLLDIFEGGNINDGFDVNDENISDAGIFALADSDNDVAEDGSDASPTNNDLDFRDDNVAPTASNNIITINEDTSHSFAATDFNFADTDTADTLVSIRIDSFNLPTGATLQLDGSDVSTDDVILLADIANLVFTPPANENGNNLASFTFSVNDGDQFALASSTITLNVTPVNDAPAGTDNTIEIDEDAPHTFSASDFGFNDANDDPANALQSAIITTLPDAGDGVLELSGVAVTAGQTITAADTVNLVFTQTVNTNGNGLGEFTFQLVDDGGTANGGENTNQSANTIDFNIAPVNDAPIAQDDGTIMVTGGTPTIIDVIGGSTANTIADSDIENDALIITAITDPADPTNPIAITVAGQVVTLDSGTTITVNGDGTLDVTTPLLSTGTETFDYTISDGNGGTDTATITLDRLTGSTPPTIDLNSTNGDTTEPGIDNAVTFIETGIDSNGNATGSGPVTVAQSDADIFDNTEMDITSFTIVVDPASVNDGAAELLTIGGVNFALNQDVTTPVTIMVGGTSVNVTFDNITGTFTLVNMSQTTPGTADNLPESDLDILLRGITYDNTSNDPTAGERTITFTVSDGPLTSAPAIATINVTASNDAPMVVAIANQSSNDSDTPTPIDVSTVFNDPDGDTLTFSAIGLPPGLMIDPVSGIISGTLENDASQGGPYTVTVTALDPDGQLITTSFEWTVANPGPDAVDNTIGTAEDVPVTFDVLGNDVDPDGDPLLVTEVTQPTNGTVVINDDGTLTYSPTANFEGVDTFEYTISDGNGGTDTATVTVNVPAEPDQPIATPIPDMMGLDADMVDPVDVSGNFSDPDGEPLTFTAVGLPTGLMIDPVTGIISGTINPSASQDGPFTVTITATDPTGSLASTSFVFDVTNPAPDAIDNIVGTPEDTPVTFDVLGNDVDPDGDPLNVTQTTQPANGTVNINADGTLTYTPNANFTGTDSFTYIIDDGNGGTDIATVTINVLSEPDQPIATPIADMMSFDSDTLTPVDVSGNFSDPDGEPLTFTAVGLPIGLMIDPVTGIISGTIDPSASQDGPYTVIITAADPTGSLASTSFVFDVTNPAPVAMDNTITTQEDTPVTIPVLVNDVDPDGDPLTISAVTQPTNGTVLINSDGTLSYLPNPDFNGTDTFTYTIDDGNGGTDTATVTVNVPGTPDVPALNSPLANETADDGEMITPINAGIIFSDPDGDTLTFSVDNLPTGLMIDPDTGIISGTIDPAASQGGDNPTTTPGVYTVTVTADDGTGNTTDVTFTYTVTNPAPEAVNETVSTPEDSPVIIDALSNDNDPDGDPLTITQVTQPTNGTVVINDDGTLTYTPNANFGGVDSFTYTIDDGNGGTDTATVTVNVAAQPDAPQVDAPLDNLNSLDGDTITPVDVSGNFSDPDGDPLTFTAIGLPTGLVVDPDTGLISGTIDPSASQEGPFTVTVTATDPLGNEAATSFVYTVTNPAPTAQDDILSGSEDAITIANLLVNNGNGVDSDPDGDTLSISRVASGDDENLLTNVNDGTGVNVPVAGDNGGLFTVNSDGTISFDPADDFNDLAADEVRITSVVYQLDDGNGGTDSAVVTFTVTGVNDNIVPIDPQNPNPQDPENFIPVQTGEDGSVIAPLDLSTFFADPDSSDPLIIEVNPEDLPEGLVFDPLTATIQGTLTSDASQEGINPQSNPGVYIISVTITDGNGSTLTTNVTFNITNPAPEAVDDTITVDEDTSLSLNANNGLITSNDFDVDGDMLFISAINGNSNNVGNAITGSNGGTFIINNDGSVDFDPSGDFDNLLPGQSTTTSIQYTLDDGNGGRDIATFTVNINGVNDAPVAVDDTMIEVVEDTPIIIDVLANDVEVDDENLTINAINGTPIETGQTITLPSGSTVTLLPTGQLSFTPAPNQNGEDSFTYMVVDGTGSTDSATVSLNIASVNDIPVNNVALTPQTNSDGEMITPVDLGSNFSDPDGDPLTFTATGLPPGLIIDPITGVVTGTLPNNASQDGPYSVTITADDNMGGEISVTFVWTVENIPPILTNPQVDLEFNDGMSVEINLGDNVTDPDNDNIVFSATGLPEGLILDPQTGIISGTLSNSASQQGPYVINVTIVDEQGATITDSFVIDVLNLAPIGEPLEPQTLIPGQETQIDTGSLFNDPDNDQLTFTAENLPEGLVIDPLTGIISGTPAVGIVDQDVTITANDNQGGITSIIIELEVMQTANIETLLAFGRTTNQPMDISTSPTSLFNTINENDFDLFTDRFSFDLEDDGDKSFVDELDEEREKVFQGGVARSNISSDSNNELVVEAVVQEHAIIVQLKETLSQELGNNAIQWLVDANEKQAESMIDHNNSDLVVINNPTSLQAVTLNIRALIDNDTVLSGEYRVNLITGEVDLLGDITRRVATFQEQLEQVAFADEAENQSLIKALR